MTTKNLVILVGVAAVLGGAAYYLNAKKAMKSPSIVGKQILPAFDASAVARIDVGGAKPLALAATDKGWVVETLHSYPADVTKIRENILKLQELKVGQVANGRTIASPAKVALKDASGKELASVDLGETHTGKPRGQMAQFDGDPKKWTDTRIAPVTASDVTSVTYAKGKETVSLTRKDGTWTLPGLGPKEELDTSKTYSLDSALSYLDFTGVADPKKTDAELGFATGAVYTVTLKNGQSYTAKVGDKTGSDRWVKLSASFKAVGTNATENATLEKAVKDFNEKTGKWAFSISSYSADNMSKTRKDLVKAKEEPKKDEAKKDDKKPEPKKDAPKK